MAVTVFETPSGDLIYHPDKRDSSKYYKVDKITMIDKTLGRMWCSDPESGRTVMISLSAKPLIRPLSDREIQPTVSKEWLAEYELYRLKNNKLHEFWHGKKRR
jgi:hypothetical protein